MSLYDTSTELPLEVLGRTLRVAATRVEAAPGARGRFLLLHGNAAHLDYWKAMAPFLARHGEVVAFDLPGFGRSETPDPCALSLDFLASTAVAVARHFGWESGVHVVGHSHGGAVAQTVAATAPSLVSGLILID